LVAISSSKFVACVDQCLSPWVGMLLDAITSVIILAPMLLAALQPTRWTPSFWMIMTLNLAIDFAAPPVAANLYVAEPTGIPIGNREG
jgi:TRAP-type C4-dicarboxylate transport system permease large subunit